MRVDIEDSVIALRRPVRTARGDVVERNAAIVRISDEAGRQGFGEGAPLPGWSSSTYAECRADLRAWADRVNAIGSIDVPAPQGPEARAAADAAHWSLRAAQSGTPLRKLLGAGPGDDEVVVNALLSEAAPIDLAAEARTAQEAGYETLKVKLGVGSDHDRISALVDAVAPTTSVRLDANAAVALDHAEALCRFAGDALGARLEYVEDPTSRLADLAHLGESVQVPLAVDELVRTPADLDTALGVRGIVALIAKPAFLGGITATQALAARAEATGIDVVISSVYDGVTGLTSWLELAAALGNRRAHGLGTAELLDDGSARSLIPRNGRISLR